MYAPSAGNDHEDFPGPSVPGAPGSTAWPSREVETDIVQHNGTPTADAPVADMPSVEAVSAIAVGPSRAESSTAPVVAEGTSKVAGDEGACHMPAKPHQDLISGIDLNYCINTDGESLLWKEKRLKHYRQRFDSLRAEGVWSSFKLLVSQLTHIGTFSIQIFNSR